MGKIRAPASWSHKFFVFIGFLRYLLLFRSPYWWMCLYLIVVISLALQEPKLVGAMTNLRPCKGKDEAKLAAKQRTKCLNQMRACNGYVEKVLPTFDNWNNNFLIDNQHLNFRQVVCSILVNTQRMTSKRLSHRCCRDLNSENPIYPDLILHLSST